MKDLWPKNEREERLAFAWSMIGAATMLLAAVLLTATGAGAQTNNDFSLRALEPPARYLKNPYPDMKIEVHYMPSREVTNFCARASRSRVRRAAACALVSADTNPRFCAVVLPTRLTRRAHATFMRHELAHCYGWPGHHPR